MMGTTTKGYPYPEGTDLVVDGDDAIQALAEAIDAKLPYAVAAGRGTSKTTSSGSTSQTTVTFPPGRFTASPNVTVNGRTSSVIQRGWAANSITTSGFIFTFGVSSDSSTTATNFDWIAVQDGAAELMGLLAADEDTSSDAMATCQTPGCPSADTPIPIQTSWTDDEGNVWPIDYVICGVCGNEITSIAPADGGAS